MVRKSETLEDVLARFVYIQPNEKRRALHAKVDAVFADFLAFEEQWIATGYAEADRAPLFSQVEARVKACATAIFEVCPESADRTAAFRSLALARNACNATLRNDVGAKADIGLHLRAAKWQANTAIAHGVE